MIELLIQNQPDDETCGPTSLHAIYHYYGLNLTLSEVIGSVKRSHSGGTLATLLGIDALKRGFHACIYINNVTIFDPTWFKKGEAPSELLIAKLKTQMRFKRNRGLIQTSKTAIEFMQLGGTFHFHTLTTSLLKRYFDEGIPILTGLSSTYLYESARESYTRTGVSYFDDIRGEPCGHFVVLLGYDEHHRLIVVADPHRENPISSNNYYKVSSQRLINAIMLGVLTYDATLLIIQPNLKVSNGNCDSLYKPN